jgi:hypothetical protein
MAIELATRRVFVGNYSVLVQRVHSPLEAIRGPFPGAVMPADHHRCPDQAAMLRARAGSSFLISFSLSNLLSYRSISSLSCVLCLQ